MRKSRTLVGLMISPLSVPITAYVFLSLVFPASGFLGAEILAICVYVGIVAYIICSIFGLPIHYFLKSKGQNTLAVYACTGVLAGCLSSVTVFMLLPGLLESVPKTVGVILVVGLAGFFVGLVFGLLQFENLLDVYESPPGLMVSILVFLPQLLG